MSLSWKSQCPRDWGHTKDYVRMQWMMLQAENPDDYVISPAFNIQLESF